MALASLTLNDQLANLTLDQLAVLALNDSEVIVTGGYYVSGAVAGGSHVAGAVQGGAFVAGAVAGGKFAAGAVQGEGYAAGAVAGGSSQ